MAARARQWFRMEVAAADPSVADLFIFDFIGDWIDDFWGLGDAGYVTTAKSFKASLDSLSDAVETIRLHVNSPGGDVFSAMAIANMLRDQRTTKGRAVETSVEGLAASAASIVIQAGDPIRIGDNALVMVHNPWTITMGNSGELRKAAAELDTIRQTIVATYRWHSALSDEEIIALMDASTWMDADEAIKNGFATEKVEGLKAAATLNAASLEKLNIPEKYRARVTELLAPVETPPAPAAAADVLRLCREAGCLDLAEGFITATATTAAVTARVSQEKQARADQQARAREIQAVCAAAKLPTLADGYIRGAMSVADVRAHVTTITALKDQVEIDGSLTPANGGSGSGPKLSTQEIYDARKKRTS